MSPLRRTGRRGLLVLHVLSIGAWIGIDVVVAVLVATGWWADDLEVRSLAYRALAELVVTPMLASALLALATGLALGWGTRWGVLQHWWVAVKLGITLVLTVLVVVALRPDMPEVGEYGARLTDGASRPDVVRTLFFPPAVSLTALTVAVWLSVFKPWGRVRRAGARGAAGRDA